jgi:4a-hydroxytetrahydrobiopterin dehydratase
MASLLHSAAIAEHLKTLPDWQQVENTIQNTFVFKDFVTAIDFVNRLVEPAESAGHHPDLSISYNKVTVSLSTHDAGGLTEKDFSMAAAIAALA